MEALIGGVAVTAGHKRKGQNMKPDIGVSLAIISAPRHTAAARTSVAPRRAFTLVELLVVMLMIALLTAMFLPSLSRARTRAQGVSCFNNLRQLQLGWKVYEGDHDDRFPPNISYCEHDRAQSYSNSWVRGNSQYDLAPNNIRAGSLFAYIPNVAAYLCPSDQATTKWNPALRHTRSYSVQWWLGGDFTVNAQVWTDPNPRGQVQKFRACEIAAPGPSEIFVFIDDHEKSVDDGIFVIGGRDWFDYPADRHRQGANLSFLDGHVERHRWDSAKIVPWDWCYYLNPNSEVER